MGNDEQLRALLQTVRTATEGKRIENDDLYTDEIENDIDALIDMVNLWASEFELEADWQFLRENDAKIGTIQDKNNIVEIEVPRIRKLVSSQYRQIKLYQDDALISVWDFVEPNLINQAFKDEVGQRATIVNNKVVFSREFKDYEIGADVRADIIKHCPTLSREDTCLLELI